jgi:hypothetical protein
VFFVCEFVVSLLKKTFSVWDSVCNKSVNVSVKQSPNGVLFLKFEMEAVLKGLNAGMLSHMQNNPNNLKVRAMQLFHSLWKKGHRGRFPHSTLLPFLDSHYTACSQCVLSCVSFYW